MDRRESEEGKKTQSRLGQGTGKVSNGHLPSPPDDSPREPRRGPQGTRSHLMIQHEQEGALDVQVSRPLHLEAVCLLGGGHPVPLAGGRGVKLITKGAGNIRRPGPARGLRPFLCPPGTAPCGPKPQARPHLYQVVVWPIQFLVQLDDRGSKEGRKTSASVY